ncbi:branched-chain amino acid ABC transporter permease [candidate division MSBL1 archaeon SCGC-AAA382C18]|uniref:Branched-chain amino acid ABC transporter permease n=1 Tax=candidate division MSBL1 archaeon SCGC-AAA382C18 TaxID=1698281 RepID=A0A133VKJ2_9EURY|nr:branched-chain amino acid ABC transporter permease [candidate division MSBL1 archaeon SCGC-AAA382C18]
MLAQISDSFFNGVVIGSILSLGAVGLTTVYRILGFPNFAHGDFLTFGAYMVLFLNVDHGLPFVLSMVGAIPIGIALVFVLEKALWKPLREKDAGNISMLIASIGLALFLRHLILFIFGSSPDNYSLTIYKGFSFAGITFTTDDLIIIAVAFSLMVLVYLLLNKTKLGKAMRALADNENLAKISGINVDRVILGTWIIGMSLAAIAGCFYGISTTVRPTMGWTLLLPMFAAVILGGIGNPYGAMIGGLIVGISQEVSAVFIPSEYKAALSFVLIIVLLLWRPKGLMGG